MLISYLSEQAFLYFPKTSIPLFHPPFENEIEIMTWNSGAGRPIFFRCWRCRRRGPHFLDGRPEPIRGTLRRVVLTGRAKTRAISDARHGNVLREYVCLDCNYIGWSAHDDLRGAATDLSLSLRRA